MELQWGSKAQSLLIRGLEQIFADAGLDMNPQLVYRMDTTIAEDEEFGWCVVGEWSKARAALRERSASGSSDEAPDESAAEAAAREDGAGRAPAD